MKQMKNKKYDDGSFVKDGVIYRKWYLLYDLGRGFYGKSSYEPRMNFQGMFLFNSSQATNRLQFLLRYHKNAQIFKIPVEVAFNLGELTTVVSICQNNEDATMTWLTEHVRETLRTLGKLDT